MVAWWWIPIAWAVGELMGFGAMIICMGKEEKEKTADADTSTDLMKGVHANEIPQQVYQKRD